MSGDNEARLRIVLDAINNAGDELKELRNDLKGAGEDTKGLTQQNEKAGISLTDLKSGFDLASQGLAYLQQAYAETIAKAAAWGDNMGDLSQLTGDTVENTSRLAAMYELVGGNAEDLTRVIKAMNSEGLSLNYANLVKLNREYNALKDPVERNTFLFKNFGKSAADMAELMGRSTEELEALAVAADKSGKVIDAAFAEKAEKWNAQLKILSQRAEGAGIQIGSTLMDSTLDWLNAVDDATEGTLGWVRGIPLIGGALGGIRDATLDFVGAFDDIKSKASDTADVVVEDTTRATDAWTQRWRGVADEALAVRAMQEAKQAAVDLSDKLGILSAGMSGEWSLAQQDFYDSQKDISLAVVETKDKIAELEQRKYLTEEQKTQLDDLKTKLGEQEDALDKNREKWEDTSKRIIFAMVQQKLAADGLSDGEITALIDVGEGLGIYDTKTADIMRNVDRTINEHGANAQAILGEVFGAYTNFQNAPNIEKIITIKYQKIGDEDFGGWTPPANPTPSTPSTPSGPIPQPDPVPLDQPGSVGSPSGSGGPNISVTALVLNDGDIERLAYKLVSVIASRS